MDIYGTEKTRLPAVTTTYWKRHKLYTWLDVYGMTYKQFIEEVIYELCVTQGTGTSQLANPHRDIKEAIGRVIDRITHRAELEGKIPNPPKDFPPKNQWSK